MENAGLFLDDTEILFKQKSYGHAFALAVLGEEELAKAIMYSNAAEGIIGIKGKWRKDLRKQKWKQTIAFSIAMIYELILILEEAADLAKKKSEGDNKRFKQIFEMKVVEILQEEDELIARKRGEVFEHLEPFEELQRKRERAMYVDANMRELRISSPRKIKKSEAKRYISHVKERLGILKYEIGRKMSASDKKMARLFIKTIVSKSGKEQKKKLLAWYGIPEKELEG